MCLSVGGTLQFDVQIEGRLIEVERSAVDERELDRQILANRDGPLSKIETMCFEQGQDQPIHAKCNARGVCFMTIFSQQVPNRTEVVTVTIEAHASGRLSFGTQWNKQLKL